jgi:IS30 family transposase
MAQFSQRMVTEVEQQFWAAMARGEFITDAAAQAGTYRMQGARWLRAEGGVRPRRGRDLKGRCLTFSEREEIALARARVEEDLRRRYSPEQIVGRLRRLFPDDPEMWVSAETIYQSLYVQSRGALRRDLTQCLRTGRALRRPCRQAGQRKNRIPAMINIAERPAQAADRAVPGHWEGDLIIGKNNASAIGTLVERTTGYTMLVHLPDGYKAEQVRDALTQKDPDDPRRSARVADLGPRPRDARLEAGKCRR